MGSVGYVGLLNYAIPLLLLTGLMILRIDVKGYKLTGMGKERKVSLFIGWLNIALGLLVFAGSFVISRWGW